MAARRSNPLALAILIYLDERPRHPYELAADMRVRHQHASIRLNYGSLYGVISALEREGLIQARETVRAGKRPERTIYTITDTGRREALDWLSELLSSPVKEYPKFEAGLSLVGALSPDEAAELLRRRLGALDNQLVSMAAQMTSHADIELPRLFALETEYAHTLVQAERRFVAELLAEIDKGTFEGLEQWRNWSQ